MFASLPLGGCKELMARCLARGESCQFTSEPIETIFSTRLRDIQTCINSYFTIVLGRIFVYDVHFIETFVKRKNIVTLF